MEECGEIAHDASKAIQFGLDDISPTKEESNFTRMSGEVEDLKVWLELLELSSGKTLKERNSLEKMYKVQKIVKYARLSAKLGNTSIETASMLVALTWELK
jgi:hypothetical protein